MAVFLDIHEGLKEAVLSGAFVADDQVVFENNKDNSNKLSPWISVFILPAITDQATLGGSGIGTDDHAGILQLDVNYPDYSGASDMITMCDTINAHFKSGAVFQKNNNCVRIGNVSISRIANNQGSATVNVSVEYFLQSSRV